MKLKTFFQTIRQRPAVTAVVLFFVAQIMCDLAGSVTLFPFQHAGMYSEPMPKLEQYETFEVTVNGKKLEAASYRIHHWESIMTPLYIYDRIISTNDFEEENLFLEKAMTAAGASQLFTKLQPNLCNKLTDKGKFSSYYLKHLEKTLQARVNFFSVYRCFYTYNKGQYFLQKRIPELHASKNR